MADHSAHDDADERGESNKMFEEEIIYECPRGTINRATLITSGANVGKYVDAKSGELFDDNQTFIRAKNPKLAVGPPGAS